MKAILRYPVYLFSLALITNNLQGQTIDTIYGCDEFPQTPSMGASCTICDFDILYGTTFPFTPSEDAGWCGSIENDQYIGFIVGMTGEVVFLIETFGCVSGNGVQVGIYDQSNMLVGDCFNQVSPQQSEVFAASGLVPNTLYYIRIDGFAGDGCEFFIQVISGLSSDGQGGYETVVVGDQSIIRYVPSPCEDGNSSTDTTVVFDGCTYLTDYRLEPDSLPYEVRTIGDVDSFQVITWPDSMDQRVLLLVELELFTDNSTGTCPDSLERPYYSHFLDLTDNASIASRAWSCSSERLVGTISGSDLRTNLHLLESGTQTYVVSGAGYHGFGGDYENTLFQYRFIQDGTTLFSGSFSENDYQDTLTINHDDGPVFLQFINDHPWQMEAAIERLGPAQPWSLNNLFDQNIASECVSSVVRALEIISPNYTNIQNANLSFQFELVSSEVINTRGDNFPTSAVLRSRIGNPTLTIDSIALPGQLPPGDYVYKGTIRPLDDLTPLCGTNDPFSVWHDFNISPPVDSVVLVDIVLSAQRDSVTIFSNLTSQYRLETNVPGTYYAYVDCTVYEQSLILSSVITVDLGVDSLCAGDCVLAPTGQLMSCVTGSYSFLASNDTTYIGELYVDPAAPFALTRTEYICDSLTGEWYLDLAWSGSRGPYELAGQTLIDSMGIAGPYQSGATINIALSGASVCIDTLFINGSYSCVSSTTTIQDLGFRITQLSNSLLEVQAPSYGWNLSFIDVLGREVYTTPLQRDANQLFVGDLLTGTYFIVVENGQTQATEKWVKR